MQVQIFFEGNHSQAIDILAMRLATLICGDWRGSRDQQAAYQPSGNGTSRYRWFCIAE
jgi:hypothetical protein